MSGDNTTDQPDTPLENLSEERNSEYLSAEDTQLKGLYESLNAVQGVVKKLSLIHISEPTRPY